tara:strand:+ start:910 stop:1647 length:738 start_codon:yes stop_codon:yes gene_type:complete
MSKININQIQDEAKGQVKEEQVWLLTYADMMTLLFAFFVLLYSMSSPDPVKASQMQEGMAKELGLEKAEGADIKSQSEINESLKEIIEDLKVEENSNITRDPRGVALEVDGDICFGSGSTILSNELKQILDVSTQKILNNNQDYRLVVIEGHTDSDPIPEQLLEYYPTNWELSSARASKVVNYLIDIGVNSGKLQAAGYADRWPADMSWSEVRSGKVSNTTILEHNNTIEKKKKNRRIKIIFTNN